MDFLSELQDFILFSQNRLRHTVELKTEQPLAAYSSMRTGGIAEAVVFPETPTDLSLLLWFLFEKKVKFTLLGRGTNTLFATKRYEGLIISTERMNRVRVEGDTLIAEAGVSLITACRLAAKAGLSGLEPLYGIPGSVGGAIAMNAGAFDRTISDLMPVSLAVSAEGKTLLLSTEDHGFSYRNSRFSSDPYTAVVETRLCLTPACRGEIYQKMDAYMTARREKQPLEYPSLGSVFKRFEGGYAARLIEDAGLKGASHGGARVSEKHAGFIVNAGGAEGEDVLLLMEYVQSEVYRRTRIRLQPEIKIVR